MARLLTGKGRSRNQPCCRQRLPCRRRCPGFSPSPGPCWNSFCHPPKRHLDVMSRISAHLAERDCQMVLDHRRPHRGHRRGGEPGEFGECKLEADCARARPLPAKGKSRSPPCFPINDGSACRSAQTLPWAAALCVRIHGAQEGIINLAYRRGNNADHVVSSEIVPTTRASQPSANPLRTTHSLSVRSVSQ